jgi:uncharacterized lipoprotein YddW (UPF0748 family)
VSGYDSESVTKGGVSTSKGSSWSWTRSGTVWDDGRNNWSESWSKSSWKDGKYAPTESESKTGGFDPKKTGPQVNDVPKFGEAPRLTKAPKKQVPPDLVKQPKPSDDILIIPTIIIKEPPKDIDLNKPPKRKPQPKDFFEPIADDKEPNILPDPNLSAGSGAPPPEKWPPQDIGSYWLSYTGTLNTKPQQRRQIFQEIINNPSIQKVYINVLSAFGVTFSPTRVDVNMIRGLNQQDVFKEFKEELDKYNSSRPRNQQRKIDVVGWFEGTGASLDRSTLHETAKNSTYQIGGNPIPNTNAVLNTKTGEGLPTLDILHPNVHKKLKEIISDFLVIHPFVNEIVFDDRYGILEEAEAEIIRRYAGQIPSSYRTMEDNKRWIQEQITERLADIRSSLPASKKISISGQNFYSAAKTNNQDLRTWLRRGLITGGLNFQLYVPGNEYDRFVGEYNQYIDNFNAVFSAPNAPAYRPPISVSLAYKARNKPLTRKQVIKQAQFLRNILPGDPPPNQRPRWPLSPQQILGFDYGLFTKINQ